MCSAIYASSLSSKCRQYKKKLVMMTMMMNNNNMNMKPDLRTEWRTRVCLGECARENQLIISANCHIDYSVSHVSYGLNEIMVVMKPIWYWTLLIDRCHQIDRSAMMYSFNSVVHLFWKINRTWPWIIAIFFSS